MVVDMPAQVVVVSPGGSCGRGWMTNAQHQFRVLTAQDSIDAHTLKNTRGMEHRKPTQLVTLACFQFARQHASLDVTFSA